jgi:hypothetical protein
LKILKILLINIIFQGKQYYYQGNIKKAIFFHNRMMEGKGEPRDSVIRRVGEDALKAKEKKSEAQKNIILLNKANKLSRQSASIQQNCSDSEDSFDLDIFTLAKNDGKEPQDEGPSKEDMINLSHAIYKVKGRIKINIGKKEKKMEDFLDNKNLTIQERLRKVVLPPKNVSQKIFINHLSPCRDIQNYNSLDFQNLSGASQHESDRNKIFRKNKLTALGLIKKFEKFNGELMKPELLNVQIQNKNL